MKFPTVCLCFVLLPEDHSLIALSGGSAKYGFVSSAFEAKSFVCVPRTETVAVSLADCIYFLNEKTKSVATASIIGFGALVAGWVCGSFLVPMIPAVLLRPTWTLELLTSLVVYVYLFLACTFLM